MRKLFHRFVPAHFHDPFGLSIRLIRSKDPAAYFAIITALMGGLLTPLDLLLQIFEKRRYRRAPRPKLPLIFVCGAPRSGTTLVSQVLIKHLSVGFINNLTSLFPRSPIVSNLLFGRFLKSHEITYKSYYGKTMHFSGPNDALYIWDRWMGTDRKQIPEFLTGAQKEDMVRFFGAYEHAFQKPLVNKNNSLNTSAHLISDVLEHATFICMMRDPVYLAQSLLRARIEIHGDVKITYGVEDPSKSIVREVDYIEDICKQVLFYEQKILEQQRVVGADRFWIISYEKFCEKPEELIERVSERVLGRPVSMEQIKATLPRFEASKRVRMKPELFERIEKTLVRLRETERIKSVVGVLRDQ